MTSFRVIADSGSTKTDWVVVDENGEESARVKTMGFNPYFHSSEFIFNEVQRAFDEAEVDCHRVTDVYYYGTGCSSEAKNRIVNDALTSLFPEADVNIDHDLVAAARAAFGNENGIAGIIGTGSNSCVWVDGQVTHNIPSHGFVFGDEGSGAYLGIRLAKLYLEGHLDATLVKAFEHQFKLTKDQILNATYKEKDPNVFLAHFASFYHPHIAHPQLRKIIEGGFKEFIEKRVLPYPNYQDFELGFVGSIAFFYQDILAEVAATYGLKLRKVSKCPIDELVDFHVTSNELKPA